MNQIKKNQWLRLLRNVVENLPMYFSRTAVRARGAVLTLLFNKIVHLKGLKDKSVGEVNSIVTFE